MMAKGVRGRRALRIYDGVDRDPRMANERISPPDSIDMAQMIANSLSAKPFPTRQRPGGSPNDTMNGLPPTVQVSGSGDVVGALDDGNIPVIGKGKIAAAGTFTKGEISAAGTFGKGEIAAAGTFTKGEISAAGRWAKDDQNEDTSYGGHNHGGYAPDGHNHDKRYAGSVGNGNSNHNHVGN